MGIVYCGLVSARRLCVAVVLVFCVLVAGLPTAAAAAAAPGSPAAVSGSVLDPAGDGVSGVALEVHPHGGPAGALPLATATSGSGGAFHLDVPPGESVLPALPPKADPALLAPAEGSVEVTHREQVAIYGDPAVRHVPWTVHHTRPPPVARHPI